MLPLPPEPNLPEWRTWPPVNDAYDLATNECCVDAIEVGLHKLRNLVDTASITPEERHAMLHTIAHVQVHLYDSLNEMRADALHRCN